RPARPAQPARGLRVRVPLIQVWVLSLECAERTLKAVLPPPSPAHNFTWRTELRTQNQNPKLSTQNSNPFPLVPQEGQRPLERYPRGSRITFARRDTLGLFVRFERVQVHFAREGGDVEGTPGTAAAKEPVRRGVDVIRELLTHLLFRFQNRRRQ